ncbi:hypothetical protein ACOKFD_16275 [Flagellimonas sp. S174]|uniref:hypothetical protein n=1 Tax=Flagellimonas sp. S174 TaxID=3410790 RepID=UPI003BF52DC4
MDFTLFSQIDYGSMVIKIICGLLASAVFLYILFIALKPKLKISEWVCIYEEEKEEKDENGKPVKKNTVWYEFKVVNRSLYNAYDVRFSLNLRVPFIVNSNKVNHNILPIEMREDYLPYIPRYRRAKGFAEHAIIVGTKHDIMTDINTANLDYELTVIAKHGLSNMTSIAYKRFESKSCVKKGHEFIFGKSLDTREV